MRVLQLLLLCALSGLAAPGATGAEIAETHRTLSIGPGARARIVAPAKLPAGKPVHLVIYALPNGNTIEETLGRAVPEGDKSRYGIQQIAAQTRFLREKADPNLVLACVEARGLSWPAWRRARGDARIPAMVDALAARFAPAPVRITLAAHSGGGSFIFGYINAVAEIPSRIERIAFLDANYAYDTDKHSAKLANWLERSSRARLCVLAYRDDRARWEGKPFVSVSGGTGGRSRLMKSDLAQRFKFWESRRGDLRIAKGAGGRAQFYIHENSQGLLLHTVQVERNGFIHGLLAGTRRANRGYEYLGEPVYREWIGER